MAIKLEDALATLPQEEQDAIKKRGRELIRNERHERMLRDVTTLKLLLEERQFGVATWHMSIKETLDAVNSHWNGTS